MEATKAIDWHSEYDILVVGSGNGAMTAGIVAHDGGAKVLLIEKSNHFGGTSATSGGGVWIPNNRYALEAQVEDSIEEARTYIKHVSPPDKISNELIETYLIKGPEMVDYLHNNSRVKYQTLEHYPDYFPDDPGGKTGHRSMEPEPIDGALLGNELNSLRPQHPQTVGPMGINFTQVEGQILLGALKGWKSLFLKLFLKFIFDFPFRFTSKKDKRLTMGNAGIARLKLSLQDRKISLWLKTEFKDIVISEGRVIGIVAEKEGKTIYIKANRGVILAAGGFEKNQQMRDQYLPNPTEQEWSAANIHNTGDAINSALKIGAKVHQMESAWWSTVMLVPEEKKARLSMVDKSLPGNFCVNKQGKRFSNESQNYVSFVDEMYEKFQEGNPCIPCFMIFDSDFRRKRPCGPILQSSIMPDFMIPKSWWTPNFLTKASSIKELAEAVGIEPNGLRNTIEKVNMYALEGKDPDFQRGDNIYDKYYGDPEVTPNPCLAPVLKSPFYCVVLYPGEMGTAGGLVIDTRSRVINKEGDVIKGLWACGNTASALLPRYPGPGSTLGPAMTFGYLAGKDATRSNT